ncbi:MAG: Eco57I restriction-modification methylase domain-containing protein, partial [Promethearchaeota archaeon]
MDARGLKSLATSIILQIIFFWALQEKGLLDENQDYMVSKFFEIQNATYDPTISDFYSFLIQLTDTVYTSVSPDPIANKTLGQIYFLIRDAALMDSRVARTITVPDSAFHDGTSDTGSQNVLIYIKGRINAPILNVLIWWRKQGKTLNEYILGSIKDVLLSQENKRKTGLYYTPPEITSYICRHSLDIWLQGRIQAKYDTWCRDILGFIKDADGERLAWIFEELVGLKVLDPACGSGHFLTTFAEMLSKLYMFIYWKAIKMPDLPDNSTLHQFIADFGEKKEEMVQKAIISEYIIPGNLYGVDIDEIAVRVARSRLLLLMLQDVKSPMKRTIFGRTNHTLNLKCGNTMVGFINLDDADCKLSKIEVNLDASGGKHASSGKRCHDIDRYTLTRELEKFLNSKEGCLHKLKVFHWCIEFPEVFKSIEPGFDIIISNPPYIDYRAIDEDERRYFREFLESTGVKAKYNLYIPFTERCMQLLKNDGVLGLIMPQKWLSASMGIKLRELMMKSMHVREIVDLMDITPPLFKNATFTNLCIIILSKMKGDQKEEKKSTNVKCNVKKIEDLCDNNGINIDIMKITRFKDKILIPSLCINWIREIFTAAYENSFKLGSVLHLNWGSSQSYGKLLSKTPRPGMIPLVQTKDIGQFQLKWQGFYIKKDFYSKVKLEKFNKIKLVISRRSPSIRAAIDYHGFALGKVSFSVNATSRLGYFCCLLNSKLFNFIYKVIFKTQHPGGSFQYDKNYLYYLPLKIMDDKMVNIYLLLNTCLSIGDHL